MQKKKLILKKKKRINIKNLYENLFQKFTNYFDYIYSLDFNEKSKYFYLRKIFNYFFVREGFNYNYVYN